MASIWSGVRSGFLRIIFRSMRKLHLLSLTIKLTRTFLRQHRGHDKHCVWSWTMSCSSEQLTIENRGNGLTVHLQSRYANNAQSATTVYSLPWSKSSGMESGVAQILGHVRTLFEQLGINQPPKSSPSSWRMTDD